MALIDHTYFIGSINIPNADRIDVQESLTYFIEKHEAEMLELILGYELYKAFVTGQSTSPIPDRLKNIVEGKEYTDIYGKVRKYKGLTENTGSFYKRSMIAHYVYYFYQRDNATQTTGVGEAATKTENAVRVSPQQKMVDAWNEAAKGATDLVCFLSANKDLYPEWDSSDARKILTYFHPINIYGI